MIKRQYLNHDHENVVDMECFNVLRPHKLRNMKSTVLQIIKNSFLNVTSQDVIKP